MRLTPLTQMLLIPSVGIPRRVMERVNVVFMFQHVLIQISHTIESRLKLRNSHLVQFIQMGNKLVAVFTDFQAIHLKFFLVEPSVVIQPSQERCRISDAF